MLTRVFTFAEMAPFYREICAEMNWELDESLVSSLQQECDEKVKALDANIEEAEKTLGETEIREAMLEKSEHFATIGDKVCRLFISWVYICCYYLGQDQLRTCDIANAAGLLFVISSM